MKIWGCIFLSLIVTYCWFMCPDVKAEDLPENIIDGDSGVISGSVNYEFDNTDGNLITIYEADNLFIYWDQNNYYNLMGGSEYYDVIDKYYGDQGYENYQSIRENQRGTKISGHNIYQYMQRSLNNVISVSTNLPIFRNLNDADIYIETGDFSNAINKNDVVQPLEVPAPYNLTMSESGKVKDLGSNDIVVYWDCGSDDNFDYNDLSYVLDLTFHYSIELSNALGGSTENGSFTISVPHTKYIGDKGSYRWTSSDISNKKSAALANRIITIDGQDYTYLQLYSSYGYLTSVVISVQNKVTDDLNNTSPVTYYTYNYLTNTEDTNRAQEGNEESPATNNPAVSGPTGGWGSSDNNSSSSSASSGSSSASATANGGTVNNNPKYEGNSVTNSPTFEGNTVSNSPTFEGNTVTNSPTFNPSYQGNTVTVNNNKSFWDLVGDILGIDEKIEDLFDSINDFVKNGDGLMQTISKAISLIVGIVPDGEEDPEGNGGLLNGIFGSVNGVITNIGGIVNSITGFIGNILNPFTTAINGLLNSVSGVLSAGSQLGQYISSGFGLLGNNGYIAMFGASMSFVPQEIWNIITLAVASGCSLFLSAGIVNFIRR